MTDARRLSRSLFFHAIFQLFRSGFYDILFL